MICFVYLLICVFIACRLKRLESVRSEVQALKITRTNFQSLGLHKKLKFGRRAVNSDKPPSKAKVQRQKDDQTNKQT